MFGARARARSTHFHTPWPPAPALGLSLAYPVGAIIAIIYGSLLPFSIDIGAVLGTRPTTALGFHKASIEDVITNLLLYVPVGCLVSLYMRRFCSTSSWAAIVAVLGSSALSLCLEWLQFGCAERVASWLDVVLNTAGAALGALIVAGPWGVRLLSRLRRLLEGANAGPALLSGGLLIYCLTPLSFVTDSQALHTAFSRAHWDVTQPRSSTELHPSFEVLVDELSLAAWFALLGALMVLYGARESDRDATDVAQGALHGFVLAALIEMLQLFSVAHTLDVASVLLRTCAAAFGAWSAQTAILPILGRDGNDHAKKTLMKFGGAAVLVAIMGILILGGPNSGGVPIDRSFVGQNPLLPFADLWRMGILEATASVLEMCAISAVLSVCALFVLWEMAGRGQRLSVVLAVSLCVLLVEILGGIRANRAFDLTPIVVAGCTSFVVFDACVWMSARFRPVPETAW